VQNTKLKPIFENIQKVEGARTPVSLVTREYLKFTDQYISNAMNAAALRRLDKIEQISFKEEASGPTGDDVSKTRPLGLRRRNIKSRQYWHADSTDTVTVPLGKTWNDKEMLSLWSKISLVCPLCISSKSFVYLIKESPRLLINISYSNYPFRQESRVSTFFLHQSHSSAIK